MRRAAAGLTLIALGVCLACAPQLAQTQTTPSTATRPTATVERIKDGDTLALTDGRTVRLLGVDTPERGRCWATEATTALTTLTPPGTTVTVTSDPTQDALDKYGRTLAYVDSTQTGDAALALIRQGAAKAYVYNRKPVQRAAQYTQAEQQARAEGLGIWAPGCEAYPPR